MSSFVSDSAEVSLATWRHSSISCDQCKRTELNSKDGCTIAESHSLVVWRHCFWLIHGNSLFFLSHSDLLIISNSTTHIWEIILNKVTGSLHSVLVFGLETFVPIFCRFWGCINSVGGWTWTKGMDLLKSSCELFVPSPRILLCEFKPYWSACLTFFPLDLHRLCLCVECEGLKDNFVNISVPIAHSLLW